MLGHPEMNLPGTFNNHDKGMQTTGVALTGAHLNQKHGFPPGGKNLESSTHFPFFLPVFPLGRCLAPWGAL